MKVSSKFFEITFKHDISKKAYLEACKWLATEVIDKDDMSEVLYEIEKIKDTEEPTFKVSLYTSLDNMEFKENFCNRCREIHKSFFVNENTNCDTCKMQAYLKQYEAKIAIKEQYKKELIIARYVENAN
jgi:hypothetical protein